MVYHNSCLAVIGQLISSIIIAHSFVDELKEKYKSGFPNKHRKILDITDLQHPKYKVLIQTVNNNEFYAAMMEMKDHKAATYIGCDPVSKSFSYYHAGKWGSVPVVIIQTGMGSNGVNSSWYETKKALYCIPYLKYIFSVGVCGGVADKVNLGDVVISKAIQGYSDLKMTPFGWINRSVHALCTQMQMCHYLTRGANSPTDGIIVKEKTVLSGPWFIADAKVQSDLLKLSTEAAAFEMEGANIVQACGQTKVECLVVKGVSDLADVEKNDDWQPQAARNAAKYLNDRINNASRKMFQVCLRAV